MGYTLVEKLMALGAGLPTVQANEIISLSVDRLMINDYVGALIFSKLEEMKRETIVSPEKVFLAVDHNMPAFTVEAADKLVLFREKAAQYGIRHMTRVGRHGIGHQMMVEHFVQPLELAVGTDSHATMYSGVGAFACGVTTTDAIAILTTGQLWMRVPETIRINVTGKLRPGVTAKDLSLKILSLFPEQVYAYKAVEIVGEAIDSMSVDSRLVLANMMAEAGAKCAIFEADEKSYEYTGTPVGERIRSDDDARFFETVTLDGSELEPMLSWPGAVTNVYPISETDRVHVDQVFIGSCTNGRMEDLMQAAEILKGRKVAEGTRLLVTPASQQIALEAIKNGTIEILMEAGATILSSSCASCAGHGPGLIGKGECCVSTTNRNFKGRMGSPEASVYLGSAYVAAASSVTGYITDPRTFLEKENGG